MVVQGGSRNTTYGPLQLAPPPTEVAAAVAVEAAGREEEDEIEEADLGGQAALVLHAMRRRSAS